MKKPAMGFGGEKSPCSFFKKTFSVEVHHVQQTQVGTVGSGL